MSVENTKALESEIISVLKRYSGKKVIEIGQMIGRDIGVYGGDGIQIADELEERFGIDLDPLIREHTIFLPPRWFDKLIGRKHGPTFTDMTVGQLVDYVATELHLRDPSVGGDEPAGERDATSN